MTTGRIQKCVDALNLHSYSNLSIWVQKLDQRVEEKLSARLEAALMAWNAVSPVNAMQSFAVTCNYHLIVNDNKVAAAI